MEIRKTKRRTLNYFKAKLIYRFTKDREKYNDYFRSYGIEVGYNCNIYSNIVSAEPYLIEIGDNVTVAGEVIFLTHDNSTSKVIPNTTDIFGKIKIGDNNFLGQRSIIMYGVTLPNNTIVAAGSVVTKSFVEEGIIIGGNPARKIGTWDKYKEKNAEIAQNVSNLSHEEKVKKLKDNKKVIINR